MTDWRENESYLHEKNWRIKWNIDFPTFDCTYLLRNCRDTWKTNVINSLLCSFECPYLWRNYRTKLRTSIINTLLWSKMFWNKYVQKYIFWTKECTECPWYIIENNSKNQKELFLWEPLFQKLQNVTCFWYIVRVLWEEWKIYWKYIWKY